MPWDCGFLCLRTERRRYIETLWKKQLIETSDERKTKRRFRRLMKGFDSEDLDVLTKAINSCGLDIKECAPGPPMDLVEDDDEMLPGCSTGPTAALSMPTTLGVNPSRITRNSSVRYSYQSSTRHNSQSLVRANNNSIHNRTPYVALTGRDENANATGTGPVGGDSSDDAGGGPRGELAPDFEDCGLIPQIDRPMSMPYLCCKMWRWKDLQVDAALHRLEPLPWCRFGRVTINNATVSCCNPYHYGLWIRPELTSSSEEQSITGIIANGGGPIEHSTLTNDTGFGDEITGTSHFANHNQNRSLFDGRQSTGFGSEDMPPSSSPPPIPTTNHVPLINHISASTELIPPPIHQHAIAWGKLARWERRERIGDVVSLVGKFVTLGKLAGSVYDGQDVKHDWDLSNNVSFCLLKRVEDEFYEDVWLYNSGEKPLFICVSSHAQRSENIRRLSPGYLFRVHRIPTNPDSSRIHQFGDPANSMSVLTISVGVGWGINYQRLFVADMPCRYEISFT